MADEILLNLLLYEIDGLVQDGSISSALAILH